MDTVDNRPPTPEEDRRTQALRTLAIIIAKLHMEKIQPERNSDHGQDKEVLL